MSDLNNFCATGRLTDDPEMKYTKSNKAVTRFDLAINNYSKDSDEPNTTFVTVIAWGKQAETVQEYLKKGSRIAISARLELQTWETEDGTKRSRHQIIMNSFTFLDSKKEESTKNKKSKKQETDDEIPF